MQNFGRKPPWLTFDCYGTLIQWDEGLAAAVDRILSRSPGNGVSFAQFMGVYDAREHELESQTPHLSFREVSERALEHAMRHMGLPYHPDDAAELTGAISRMPPFPEVPAALSQLKRMGFKLCIVSNTDDAIIAGNVAQLAGHIDRVVTAQQAQALPSGRIFEYAHRTLGVTKDELIHICASPHLDLQAARDLKFRCIWIDRNSGRKPLCDYTPDAILDKLDRVPALFKQLGW